MISYLSLLFLALTLIALAVYFFWRWVRTRQIRESLSLKLYLIRLPLQSTEGKDLKKEISVMEQLFSALTSFNVPVVFEVAVSYVGEEISFYVAIKDSFAEALFRQIQALWADAEITKVDDYNIFNSSGVALGSFLKQKEKYILPVKTYDELNADTFLPLLGGLTKVSEFGEGAAIQIIIEPAAPSYKKTIKEALKNLKKGESLAKAFDGSAKISFADVSDALSTKKKEEKPEKIIDEDAVKAVERKLTKPLFEVNVRIFASAPAEYQTESILNGITAGLAEFSAPTRNEFKIVKPKNFADLVHQFSFRLFDKSQAMILNSEELASIFHFPTSFTSLPRIKYLKAREASPPSNLPKNGVLIGKSIYRGEDREVKITDDDRRRHIYIIGQTGTGKSNLLVDMVNEDILAGKGVAIVDPHGDLCDAILGLIPKNRFNDVVIFDPSDLSQPLGLNMIEYNFNRPEEKTFIVNEMQSIFNKLFTAETMGPMFEQYMRNALLLLMEDADPAAAGEPATLMEVPRVFTDAAFRERKLRRIKNPSVIDFWEKEAVKAGGEAALSNMTPYITSKFNNFTANDYMRIIIGQTKSAFDFRKMMDEGKILLVNLAKGKIGDINANLLGMIIVGKILMAALGRTDLPQEKRRDFNLYIDEFQNFTTDSISTILSEARKYRLNLVIAHQFIGQLSEKIRDAVFGNVGSIITFRVGAQDAEFLVKQFEPVFKTQDLLNIDNFNAYVKMLINGQTSSPFNIKTLPAEKGKDEVMAELKNLSREKFGRPRAEVEENIYKRLRN